MDTATDIVNIKPTLALNAAILAVQSEIGIVVKDGENPHFRSKYATLKNIWKTIRPVLTKAGIIVSNHQVGDVYITAIIHAKSGERMETEFPITTGGTPQAIGSMRTYARRYNLCDLLQICTDEDDDGEAAEGNTVATPPATATAKPKPSQTAPKTAPLGPEFCPFKPFDKWEAMDTEVLQRALKYNDAKMTDKHRKCIEAVIATRVAKGIKTN